MSIRWRLTVWYTCILAVTLVLFGASIYGLVRYNIYSEVKKKIVEQAKLIRDVYIDNQGQSLRLDRTRTISLGDAQISWQLYNYLSGNIQRSDSLFERQIILPVPAQNKLDLQGTFKSLDTKGYSYVLYELPIPDANNQVVGAITLAVNTAPQNHLLDQMKTMLVLGFFITILMASTLGLFLARKSMRPIGKVIEAANQIQTGNDLSVRIDYEGPNDEIGQLIGTVNNMLTRMDSFYKELDEAYAAQRRFVSDASHELRTPLTTIRGNVDLLKKAWNQQAEGQLKIDEETLRTLSIEAVSDISDESKRMTRLVNDMLSLARADTGQTFTREPIFLPPLVQDVIRRSQFLPRNAAWLQGDLSDLDGVYVDGNQDYLQQMLFIFIENAFKYTPDGKVMISALKLGNQVGIRIHDTGIGMDKEDIPYIFERFYRADPSRGVTQGTGLGLSIAKWIIDEHGGSVEVMTRKDEGTSFVIWLPIFPTPLQ
ncbi:signal transduction histidine kinase [Paenibacillus shirakamiensis]|uniref:histidine kinase n=1 Tax=Paenibacillus shirakamiensis TaxID=1265935 RepID=A0ABS4JKF1_9BACL|nr:HAMP domain-containing sensor histidine kinase [Paenibacillus shirakamiensis]MBP2002192.1 signal transduction histidine kinase [Paenibacillus shirakamiensis]